MPNPMTIGQLAAATGVAARTIRYYEAAGVLPPPARSPAGYRQYDDRHVRRLLFVRRARALRLPLGEVHTLADAFSTNGNALRPRLLVSVRAQLMAVRRQIADLEALRQELQSVLRRAPRAAPSTEGCRCLEPSGGGHAPRNRARRLHSPKHAGRR